MQDELQLLTPESLCIRLCCSVTYPKGTVAQPPPGSHVTTALLNAGASASMPFPTPYSPPG